MIVELTVADRERLTVENIRAYLAQKPVLTKRDKWRVAQQRYRAAKKLKAA